MPRDVKKSDLPKKVCPACGRPFPRRKKRARAGGAVRFCSDRCRGGGKRADAAQGCRAFRLSSGCLRSFAGRRLAFPARRSILRP